MSNDLNVTPRQFFNDVVYELEEVVKEVRLDLVKPINGTNIHTVIADNLKLFYHSKNMLLSYH